MNNSARNYYELLGVSRDATDNEIRKAYLKLAREHHPDKSKLENAEEVFKKLGKAYAAIKTEEDRIRYNLYLQNPNLNPNNYQNSPAAIRYDPLTTFIFQTIPNFLFSKFPHGVVLGVLCGGFQASLIDYLLFDYFLSGLGMGLIEWNSMDSILSFAIGATAGMSLGFVSPLTVAGLALGGCLVGGFNDVALPHICALLCDTYDESIRSCKKAIANAPYLLLDAAQTAAASTFKSVSDLLSYIAYPLYLTSKSNSAPLPTQPEEDIENGWELVEYQSKPLAPVVDEEFADWEIV